MYYDSYELKNGDGFYPSAYSDNASDSQIDIEFELYDDELTQLSGPTIKGYDGNTYYKSFGTSFLKCLITKNMF